jgi:hypothetical protein
VDKEAMGWEWIHVKAAPTHNSEPQPKNTPT